VKCFHCEIFHNIVLSKTADQFPSSSSRYALFLLKLPYRTKMQLQHLYSEANYYVYLGEKVYT